MPSADKKIDDGKWFRPDEQFNKLYPPSIQTFARRHLAAAWVSFVWWAPVLDPEANFTINHTRYLSFSQKG